MRNGLAWLICVLVLVVGSVTTWSLTRGQTPAPPPAAPGASSLPPLPTAPAAPVVPAPATPPAPAAADAPAAPPRTEGDKPTSLLYAQVNVSARRGAEWLARMHDVKGRFHQGFVPALNTVMEGDHALRQAGAAFALARAARFTADKGHEVRATQAILALLDETVADPAKPDVIVPRLPSSSVNRLAAAGLLVLAISELPAPQEDLVKKMDGLCQFLRSRQRADGSLHCGDDDRAATDDPEAITAFPGVALHGLMRSQRLRPAAWKTEMVRKALAFYAPWWRAHKRPDFIPAQTAAYAEAFLLTREKPFADFVAEMNEWLCGLQYENLGPRHPEWYGGFAGWSDGKPVGSAPDIRTASYAESLAEACRVARESADLARYERFSPALERALQFLVTLQYTEANTKHFVDWYRLRLLGGFHGSHQDGDLRIDATQHAVCAMIQYLTHVAR